MGHISLSAPGLSRLQTPEMKLTAVLLLGSLSLCHAGNGNAMERLLDDLFEDSQYNSFAIPMESGPDVANGDNALNVAVGLGARNIDMDPAGNLVMNAWLKAMWKDFRLMWEPSEYDGVDRLFLPSEMIWTPDLSVYNGADYGQDFSDQNIKQSPHKVVILNTGTVVWIPAIKIHADCSDEGFVPTQPANPAEERDCHVKLGSWVMDARHVNLTSFGDDELNLDDISRNSPYMVVSREQGAIKYTKYDCCPEPYMNADFRFKVKRAYHIQDGVKVMDLTPEEIDEMVKNNKKPEQWVE